MKPEVGSTDWTHGDDHEGSMARNQLHRLNDITDMLLDMLNDGDDLPAWVQSKITRAYTDLNDVFGYLEPQSDKHNGMTQLTSEVKKGLWANIWKRRRAGKKPKRPGEKGYPKTLDIDK
jgi:hypothetical protein